MEYREVRTFAEEYFAGSSALNRRILEDIASVRSGCSQDWDTLPVLQQEQVTTTRHWISHVPSDPLLSISQVCDQHIFADHQRPYDM